MDAPVPRIMARYTGPFWGVRDPDELKGLWNDTRLVSKQFKSVIERIFREEHVPRLRLCLPMMDYAQPQAHTYGQHPHAPHMQATY